MNEADRAGAAGDARADPHACVRDALCTTLQDGYDLCRRENFQYALTGLLYLVADSQRLAGVRYTAVAEAPDRQASWRLVDIFDIRALTGAKN